MSERAAPIEGHYLPLSGMAAMLTARGLKILSPGGLSLTKTSFRSTIFVAWDVTATEQSFEIHSG